MANWKKLYRERRKKYIKDPSNEKLVLFLRAKGRLGRWDARMHAYTGVATNVTPAVKKHIARGYGRGLVPTSTTGGRHAPGSFHYSGRAADMGLRGPEIGTEKGRRRMVNFQRSEYKRGGLVELIGPDNTKIILKGQRTTLSEGAALEQAHDNHTHGAF